MPVVAVGQPVAMPTLVTAFPTAETIAVSQSQSHSLANAERSAAVSHSEALAKAEAVAAHSRTMPLGLCAAVSRSVADFPMRIMIVDNSGSMQSTDGKRLVPMAGGGFRSLTCTRWEELSNDVIDVCALADALNTRLDVHLLNPRGGFNAASICTGAWNAVAPIGKTMSLASLRSAITAQSPGGLTPLTESVTQIIAMLAPHAELLRAKGQRVVVIVATDGLPNDKHSFLQAMMRLQTLPVWVIVRLCTDDDRVVEYWNELDAALEAPLEVLDDVRGEATEVGHLNSWLTYGPALHLARLFGLPGQLYDCLDEVRLVPSQIKSFVEDVLGCDLLPEPQIDPKGFVTAVKQALDATPDRRLTWCPRSGRVKPWLDERALERAMRGGCLQNNKDSGCALM